MFIFAQSIEKALPVYYNYRIEPVYNFQRRNTVMMVSTKGRYALRVMTDLAENNSGKYITLSDIAKRQGISEKYLESIVSGLSKKGLVDALRGKGGGYRLSRAPGDYRVSEILEVTEGSLAPVSCLENGRAGCERVSECPTFGMWEKLYEMINTYFSSVTLESLMHKQENPEK